MRKTDSLIGLCTRYGNQGTTFGPSVNGFLHRIRRPQRPPPANPMQTQRHAFRSKPKWRKAWKEDGDGSRVPKKHPKNHPIYGVWRFPSKKSGKISSQNHQQNLRCSVLHLDLLHKTSKSQRTPKQFEKPS